MVYTLVSGTASDAYDLADRLDVFLVNTLGWNRSHTIASGAGSRDRVYNNTPPEAHGTLYARFKADSNLIYNYAYSYYQQGGGYSTGAMGGTQETANPGSFSGSCGYWMFGDQNVVWLITNNTTSGTYYASSVGYVDTYYCPKFDYLPVYVAGQRLDTLDFTSNRVMMYDSASGTGYYHAENYANLVKWGSPQHRDNTYFGMSVSVVNDTIGKYEIRGELPGIRQVYGSPFLSEDTAVISGTGQYIIMRHGNSINNTFMYGPYTQLV